MYFAARAKKTLQAALEELENLFEISKDKKADIEIIIDKSMMGIETLLGMMTIALQNGRENNQEDLSSHDNNITPPFDKGKAKSNKF